MHIRVHSVVDRQSVSIAHMESENLRIVFLHDWGIGPTAALAIGRKTALDLQKQ